MLCAGSGCVSSGCEAVRDALMAEIAEAGIGDRNKVVQAGCIGCCTVGPIMMVYPEGIFYQHVSPRDVPQIVESHLRNGRPVTKLLRPKTGDKKEKVAQIKEIDYFSAQKQNVLSNCGLIDPSRIEDYIAMDGYQGLYKALNGLSRDEVIAEVTKSGLRGRGGAGFPTGRKWEFAKNSAGSPKYIICNADEGDPGAFMDRSALERDPHSVLEGMIVCGYAVGSPQGYVYVRAEYPLAVERLQIALDQARSEGLLGKNILGSGFDFDVEIRIGAGAFVCGEETALMNSIEGQRGEPRLRPPYPAVSGLWKCPTNINNVETFANVPYIIREGGEEYAQLGTTGSKGTKVFALAGDAVNSGLCEVPMGATLNEIVFDIGGGIIGGRKFKAAQLGGPSGGCIPSRYGDTPIDYESLIELGAMMGSGGLIVMDEDTCMVDMAKFFMEFVQDESCGKCPPCRAGSKRMLEILTRISEGKGRMEDIDTLKVLGDEIKIASLCGLGQTAPNPVLSTLRHFMDEYVGHCQDKQCVAGVCKPLFHFDINDSCTGCTLCARKCPVVCIEGEKKQKHVIDQAVCTKCGNCYDVCNFKAVGKVPGSAEREEMTFL
ncbi:MAG: NADH-ubiquinone oxidoreductase-F iron-sulfur binding region domain-containing protein [bacterium]